MSARRVALLFGGRSVEHEVSLVSARGVATAMRETPLTLVPIAVDSEGRWIDPESSQAILDSDATRVPDTTDGQTLALVPGRGLTLDGAALEVDVVFPLIHGWGGEDGRLQGALELAGIPYVGAGVAGSAVGMAIRAVNSSAATGFAK